MNFFVRPYLKNKEEINVVCYNNFKFYFTINIIFRHPRNGLTEPFFRLNLRKFRVTLQIFKVTLQIFRATLHEIRVNFTSNQGNFTRFLSRKINKTLHVFRVNFTE